MNNVKDQYFEWLCEKVNADDSNISYVKLMTHMHKFNFVALMKMDENREHDGIDLRYRFGIEEGVSENIIHDSLDDERCSSVLEMIVALAIRCEETIMTDDDYGDRTGMWFWNMIMSLGLGTMSDSRFDDNYVSIILEDFINRNYKRNGEGGLFTIDGIKKDMRKVEIWYQMSWYIDLL